ncbi:MAG: hypothetical protein R6V85_08185 [Polyangia bacterium]
MIVVPIYLMIAGAVFAMLVGVGSLGRGEQGEETSGDLLPYLVLGLAWPVALVAAAHGWLADRRS